MARTLLVRKCLVFSIFESPHPHNTLLTPQILHKLLFSNPPGITTYSREYLKTAHIWRRYHCFPRQMTSEKPAQTDSTLMTRHYPQDLGSASDWSYRMGNLIRPIKSTIQIWVVTRHQYGISALVSQTSFGGETSGNENNNLRKFWGSALRRI